MPSLSRHWKIVCVFTVLTVSGCSASRSYVSIPFANLRGESRFAGRTEPLTSFKGETAAQHFARENVLSSAEPDATSRDPAEIVPVSHSTDMPDDTITPMVEPVERPSESASWTLAALESIALQQNPAVLQASASAHKAMGYRNQVGLKPNPVIGYQASQLADEGTDQHVAFVEQDIVLGDKLQKNQRVLSQEIQSQLWEVETQRFRVLTDIRQQFYEALAAQRRVVLAEEFTTIAAEGVATAEGRIKAKLGIRPELLQAEIQLKQVQLQGRQAMIAFKGAWQQLMATAGMPGVAPGTLAGELASSSTPREWETLKTQILTSSPELQGARARFARARANLNRQQAQSIPNLSLLVGAGHDNGTNSGMLNTQIGMPLPIHNRNQGNIAAAHAEYCRAAHDVRRTEMAIQSRLAIAVRDVEVAALSVAEYHNEIVPRAEETLLLVEDAHRSEGGDFLQVLVARQTLFDAKQAYVTAQADLAKATVLIDGQVLSGGLESTRDTEFDSGLRDQALSGQ